VVTVISALVRVPVLSVQMTVVDPSVSTAASRLIRAWRAAIRRTAMARDTDKVAGRPSGTSATMTPRANTKLSTSPAEVVAVRRPKTIAASATATADTCLAIRLTLRCSGLATSATWAVSW
jgi:hypothetical protein